MITYEFLQIYWWLLISVLGAILVFLLFVQGGQSLILDAKTDTERELMVNSVGRKWELTFTTLVVFGGAFFASFPLFYSTSFGGAYWLWIMILLSFVLQSVSFKFRSKLGNILGRKGYDTFLFINGVTAPILLGVVVATFFFGASFTVEKSNLLNVHSPVISRWVDTHGLEAVFNLRNLLVGAMVLFLSRTQAILYFMNNIDDEQTFAHCKKLAMLNGGLFVLHFLLVVGALLTSDGYQVTDGQVSVVAYKYLFNYLEMWWALLFLLVGVVLVLYGLGRSVFAKHFTKGIWFTGIGTVLVVLSLFWVAGYNGTPYYPSLVDPNSSLTIYNSSSSEYTLTVMSLVSLLIPFVLGYIVYAWYSMNKEPITAKELEETTDKC